MRHSTIILFTIVVILIALAIPLHVLAQTPPSISYQGMLEQNGVPMSGTDTLTLAIYAAQSGGTPLYTEKQSTVVTNGLFNVSIGTVEPLMPTLDFSRQYYLGVAINGGTELSPRSVVSFAPYAFRALNADTASYAKQVSGAVSSVNNETGAISLKNGNGIVITNTGATFTISATGVQTVNGQTGAVTLVGAGGTTVSQSGAQITITSQTFTGGTGIQAIQNSDTTITIVNGTGPIATITLAKQNATSGQVLAWNGSAWRPETLTNGGAPDSIKDLQDCRDDGSSIYLGAGSGVNNSGKDSNVALGIGALHANTTGYDNIAIGDSALAANTNGNYNIAIGKNALIKLNPTTGSDDGEIAIGEGALQYLTNNNADNTVVGYQALNQNGLGGNNTAIGYEAMQYAVGSGGISNAGNEAFGYLSLPRNTGAGNAAIGWEAMFLNTSGSYNSVLGYGTLAGCKTGSYNTACGVGSLGFVDSGSYNVAMGYGALRYSLERSHLVAVGDSALYYNGTSQPMMLVPAGGDSATANTAVGAEALLTNGTGAYNTAEGYHSLYANSVGYRNTAMGYDALNQNLNGNDNTAVGSSAGPTTSLVNTTAIGSGAIPSASNSVVLGNVAVTSLYCMGAYAATTANSANLVVTSSGQIMRSTSSARYKTNIHDLDFDADAIYDLRPVSYISKIDGKSYFGLVAEDVAKVLPELAEYAKAKDVIPGSTSDNLIPDAVKYPMLSVLLLQELKKEHAKEQAEEKTISDLEQRVEKLEAVGRER